MFRAFVFDKNIDLKIKEVREGVFFESREFSLEALPMDHGIETLGYSFLEKERRRMNPRKLEQLGIHGQLIGKLQDGQSVMVRGNKVEPDDVSIIVKGKKITYITDTKLCENCFALSHGSDILICESTYGSTLEGKGEEYSHMTAAQAAQIAKRCGVGNLYLTHFSARYKDVSELEEEAREIFEHSACANDFMKVKL